MLAEANSTGHRLRSSIQGDTFRSNDANLDCMSGGCCHVYCTSHGLSSRAAGGGIFFQSYLRAFDLEVEDVSLRGNTAVNGTSPPR